MNEEATAQPTKACTVSDAANGRVDSRDDEVGDGVASIMLYRKSMSVRHTIKVVLRNALCAALVRIAIGILKTLVRRRKRCGVLACITNEVLSLDPLKWATVTAGVSSFRACMQLFSRVGRYVHVPETVAAFLSGCVCAAPALVLDKSTRMEFYLYTIIRALHTGCLRFVKPRLPEALQRFGHYDVLLMCVCSSQIAYALLYSLDSVTPAYRTFLLNASMHEEDAIRGSGGLLRHQMTPHFLRQLWRLGKMGEPTTVPTLSDLCEYEHSGLSCDQFALRFVWRNMVTVGLPLYGPLRAVLTLTLDRKRLMTQPLRTIGRGLRSIATSSLFLGVYCVLCSRPHCYARQHGITSGLWYALATFPAGLATLLEPKSRRMDLALYCSVHALRSFAVTQYRLGHLPFYVTHRAMFLIYLLSAGFLFFEYEEEPKLLHPRLYALFRFVLGEKPQHKTHHNQHATSIH